MDQVPLLLSLVFIGSFCGYISYFVNSPSSPQGSGSVGYQPNEKLVNLLESLTAQLSEKSPASVLHGSGSAGTQQNEKLMDFLENLAAQLGEPVSEKPWCESNPLLKTLRKQTILDNEENAKLAIQPTTGILAEEQRSYDLSQLFYPTVPCSFVRLGGDKIYPQDGAKWHCNADFLFTKQGNCLLYSFGSYNDFSWEEAILDRYPNCRVHTFDCTVAKWEVPPQIADRVTTHSICIGTRPGNSAWLNYKEIRAKLGHEGQDIQYFKMDIEGGEMEFIKELIANGGPFPNQIGLELHTPSYDISEFARIMHGLGYRVAINEYNFKHSHCIEVLFIRVFC